MPPSLPPLTTRLLTTTAQRSSLLHIPIRTASPHQKTFTTSAPHLSEDAHSSSSSSHYDPPSGWLWGVPPGEKKEKEGWEGMWVYGMYGSLLVGVVAYAYKPDSS